MRLLKFECEGFRGLNDVVFEPGPGRNIIRGDNAQGKTTLLEAILFAATSKSHRTNVESDLLAQDAASFRLCALVQRSDRDVAVEANWYQGAKRFKVNGVAQLRVSEILGRIHVVLFSPEDVNLVKGGASQRRRFLDMELSQIHPGYLNALQQYRQVLRQRNELLRRPNPDIDLIAVWDEQLAQHGRTLIRGRAGFVHQLSGLTTEAYHRVADAETLTLAYRPSVPKDADLHDVLRRERPNDIRRRATQYGPHRDDLELLIADRPARTHASQGQQKTAALALKLAELELVKARIGEYPILMLDEVLAELDRARARRLFEAIPGAVQCMVTTTETSPEGGRFGADAMNFLIEGGRLEKIG